MHGTPSISSKTPRCLIVRPVKLSDHGGDEVVYRRSSGFLSRYFEIDTLELLPITRWRAFFNVRKFAPPEILRWISADNTRRVQQALTGADYDAVYFFNEITFPSSRPALASQKPIVLVAHNVHSVVARSDGSLPSLLGRFICVHFERLWYADRRAELVCISNNDVAGLRKSGIKRTRTFVAPPGAPPAEPFPEPFRVNATAVLTGSYGWWRKRRDLKAFLASAPSGLPVYTSDAEARAMFQQADWPVIREQPDFGAAMHFGLITDRFEGGFKLKALEYLAKNCAILAYCDLSAEFVGLPHAAEFVRRVGSIAEIRSIMSQMQADDPTALGERFKLFRQACLERYKWSECLLPLYQAYNAARSRVQGLAL